MIEGWKRKRGRKREREEKERQCLVQLDWYCCCFAAGVCMGQLSAVGPRAGFWLLLRLGDVQFFSFSPRPFR